MIVRSLTVRRTIRLQVVFVVHCCAWWCEGAWRRRVDRDVGDRLSVMQRLQWIMVKD